MLRLFIGLALAAVLGAPRAALAAGDSLTFQPPRFTREQIEAGFSPGDHFLVVYGTREAGATADLRERGLTLATRLLGGDSADVRADRDVAAAEIAAHHVLLLGGPSQNDWTRRLAPALPVVFVEHAFRWFGRTYERPGDAIHLVYANPLAPRRFLMLVAANSNAGLERRGGGFVFGSEDWRILRDGELARSGTFAQDAAHPWHYVAALDHDRERDREHFTQTLTSRAAGGVTLKAPPGLANVAAIANAAEQLGARLDRLGYAPAPSATLTLYRSLEQKGELARSTRPEHLEPDGSAHAALPAGRDHLDLWTLAAQRLRALGANAASPYLRPASTWLTGSFEDEPLERSLHRLYFGHVLPNAAEAAARPLSWRSPLVEVPARAVLVQSLVDAAGARGRAALRAALAADPPGTLDSLCARCGVSAAAVSKRYLALADSLARAGEKLPGREPKAWRPADGFIRGVSLAHSARIDGGYLSAACGRSLDTLHAMGANWVALTPFGYLPSPRVPEIFPSAEGGPEEETDEAVCEAGAMARARGLRVFLAPHLWTRGWVGDLQFGTEWPRFFERYRAFILHYALLADREGFDGLLVGHELVTATASDPERFRALIADVRRVYGGTLTYAANWGDEVKRIPFWDALDLISVSFYVPLAERPTADVAALRTGATKALHALHAVAEKEHRPVLLGELGYPARTNAAATPWDEQAGALDLESQRACYEAVIDALDPELWVAGAVWWKWPSSAGESGPHDPSFSPRGKPAEAQLRRSLGQWRDRPVQVPK